MRLSYTPTLRSTPARITLAFAVLIVALAGAIERPRAAAAHPLGNFTINRYAQLTLGADSVRTIYALDMAEIPTFQEMDSIDRDHNGTVSDAEQSAYLGKKLPELAGNLKLTINGNNVPMHAESGTLSFSDGQGGLKILRIDAVFTGKLPANLPRAAVDAQVQDHNYDDRLGWKEIVIQGSDSGAVSNSSVLATGASDALRSYPQDMLASPLNVHEARFRFEPGVAAVDPGPQNTAAQVAKRTSRAISPGVLGAFADSAATKTLTAPVIAFLLLAAVFWGAVHAVGPGHGKTVVAAYLVGSKGTTRHAVVLGLTVTATHTASTYLLGFITLFASHYVVPEKLYPALTLSSGVLVVVLGVALLIGRLRSLHVWPFRVKLAMPQLGPALMTAGVGVLDTADANSQNTLSLTEHSQIAAHGHSHGPAAGSGLDDVHGHSHGPGAEFDPGHGHSHAVPGFDGKPLNWRSLLSLGVYGGLLPCPTAIVVLLTSISLNRVGFGLLLVVAFSFGLAAVLTGIGIMLVQANRALTRFSSGKLSGRVATLLPVASAAAVIIAGLLITLRAAGQGSIPMI